MDQRLISIYREHAGFVMRSLARFGIRGGDVDDLTQEVFIRVAQNLASFDDTRPIRPWLWGFTRRLASDYRKLARHRFEQSEDDHTEGGTAEPEAKLAAASLVHRALALIGEEQAEIIILREMEGFTLQEAAEMIGVPLQTLVSRQKKAVEAFVAAVRHLSEESAPQKGARHG